MMLTAKQSEARGVRDTFEIFRKEQEPVPAVILSFDGFAEAYDIVRSLGKQNIYSIVASCQKNNIASYSRFCNHIEVLPSVTGANDVQIVETLVNLSKSLNVRPVLFYVSDPELALVGKFRETLEQYYRFLLPDDDTLEKVFNKVHFIDFAHRHNFPVPVARRFENSDELNSHLSEITFPCIVKPAFSSDWVWDTEEQREKFGKYKEALRRFTSIETLVEFCASLPQRPGGFLVQSYLDGRDDTITSFHGYFDEDSFCLGSFIGQKIRTYPPHTGGSVYIRTIHDYRLERNSIEYLQRIRFRGVVKIDYKWDASREEYKMLEINPRYNLWELLGSFAGVNLAALAYRHQTGVPTFSYEYDADVRLLFLKQDLRAYLSGYRKNREWPFVRYCFSLVRKTHYRILSGEDPLPFAVACAFFVRRNLGRLFRAIFSEQIARRVTLPQDGPLNFSSVKHS